MNGMAMNKKEWNQGMECDLNQAVFKAFKEMDAHELESLEYNEVSEDLLIEIVEAFKEMLIEHKGYTMSLKELIAGIYHFFESFNGSGYLYSLIHGSSIDQELMNEIRSIGQVEQLDQDDIKFNYLATASELNLSEVLTIVQYPNSINSFDVEFDLYQFGIVATAYLNFEWENPQVFTDEATHLLKGNEADFKGTKRLRDWTCDLMESDEFLTHVKVKNVTCSAIYWQEL